jgi:hypothetical protein
MIEAHARILIGTPAAFCCLKYHYVCRSSETVLDYHRAVLFWRDRYALAEVAMLNFT